MKKILGVASAAAAAVACIAVGTAGTASADPELNGTYNFVVDETQATTTGFPMKNPEVETTQWIVASCGPGCANVTVPDHPNGGGQLKLVDGRWEMSKDLTLMNCTGGAGPDVTVMTSLDAATLQGSEVNTNHCINNVITSPATLTPA